MLNALSVSKLSSGRERTAVAAMLAAPVEHRPDTGPGTKHWLPERPRVSDTSSPRRRTELDDDIVEIATRAADALAGGETLVLSNGTQLPGSRLRILGRIGDGGCGVVYRGEHIDLQRQVAIKVLRDAAPTTDAREQFLDEARVTTRIESPYVVQVVDFGELPDGRAWYAMEHLGGRTLEQIIDGQPVDPARAIGLLRMACKGLAAAHGAGVVHRDVKPQNFVVIARGGREHLVVVDFGIALPCGTKPSVVSGTPEYMAREQILRDTLDARTDVYSLGCCAFELLTGRPLVELTATVQQALLLHTDGIDPQFPAGLAIPEVLKTIVRRCLAVEREQRFADMNELEAALCEAQIEARLPPVRDDLELPMVDGERRRRIAEGFAVLARPRRPLQNRAALLSSAVIAAAVALVAIWPGQPAAADDVQPAMAPAVAAAAVLPITSVPMPVDETEPPATVADEPIVAVAVVPEQEPTAASKPARGAAMHATPREVNVSRRAALAAEIDADARPTSSRASLATDAIRDGRRALRRGDRAAAEVAFRRALHLDARSSGAVAGLADVHFERGEHDRAMQFAKLAVQRAPGSAAHRIRLGDAYYRLARLDDARTQYAAAKELGSAAAARRLAALGRSGG